MAVPFTLPARRRKAPHRDLTDRYRAQVLEAFPGRVERIVLFGSRVRAEAREDSDWDFAVYLDHAPDEDEQRRLREIDLALTAETGEEVREVGPGEVALICGDQEHEQVALEEGPRFVRFKSPVGTLPAGE